jgi:hypothetical protein
MSGLEIKLFVTNQIAEQKATPIFINKSGAANSLTFTGVNILVTIRLISLVGKANRAKHIAKCIIII